jgi:uncharacterized protein
MPQIIELDQRECLSLLRAGSFGRFGLQTEEGPLVVPVNYVVRDDTVAVQTSPLGVLATYGHGATVAFEVDQVDEELWHGWSVVARGQGRLVHGSPPGGPARARPWADGDRSSEFQLTWSELTGRRIGTGRDVAPAAPARWMAP